MAAGGVIVATDAAERETPSFVPDLLRKLVFEIDDWEGRAVRLYKSQWKHICDRHPEMADALESIRVTITDPDIVSASDTKPMHPDADRRVHSRRDTHPRYRALYVRVPIEYGPQGNWVVTAYINPLPPDGDLIYVRIPSR